MSSTLLSAAADRKEWERIQFNAHHNAVNEFEHRANVLARLAGKQAAQSVEAQIRSLNYRVYKSSVMGRHLLDPRDPVFKDQSYPTPDGDRYPCQFVIPSISVAIRVQSQKEPRPGNVARAFLWNMQMACWVPFKTVLFVIIGVAWKPKRVEFMLRECAWINHNNPGQTLVIDTANNLGARLTELMPQRQRLP